jgi:hypothetical protein
MHEYFAAPKNPISDDAPDWQKAHEIDDVLLDKNGEPPKQGVPLTAILYQGKGREKHPEIYGKDVHGSVFGDADYYAITYDDARPYGPDISNHRVSLKNPAVIHSDKDVSAWVDGEPIPWDNESRIGYFARVSQTIKDAGHDGIVVSVPYSDDVGFSGGRVKRLREVFGVSQVVVFKGTGSQTK